MTNEEYKPNSEEIKKAEETMTEEQKQMSRSREEGYRMGQLKALGLERFNDRIFYRIEKTEEHFLKGDEKKRQEEFEQSQDREVLLQKTLEILDELNRRIELPDDEVLIVDIRLHPLAEERKREIIEQTKQRYRWKKGEELEGIIEEELKKSKQYFTAQSYPQYSIAKKDSLKSIRGIYASNAYIFLDSYGSKYGGEGSREDYVNDILEQLEGTRKKLHSK